MYYLVRPLKKILAHFAPKRNRQNPGYRAGQRITTAQGLDLSLQFGYCAFEWVKK